MSSNNFPSFSNRNANFGSFHPQPPSQTDSSTAKVYHVPIHIEKDDGNQSYIKMNEQQPGYQSNQPNYQQQQPNYQQNNSYHPNQQQPNFTSNQPSSFYQHNTEPVFPPSNLSNFRERAESEFKRQQDELRNKSGNQQHNQTSQSGNNEYRIPIRIEGDSNEPNNLARDFNKMHCPSAVRTSKPGQKNSTQSNPDEFMNCKEFDNVPASFNYQQPMQNSQFIPQQSMPNSQFNPQQQTAQAAQPQIRKAANPMTIIQSTLEEVEKYENEIDNFTGEYQDKQYRYLDEYLTRCMLKLDTIDVDGDLNLKQARKNALNYINKVITKLEQIEHRKGEVSNEKVDENDAKVEQQVDNETVVKEDQNVNDAGSKPTEDEKSNEQDNSKQADSKLQEDSKMQENSKQDEKAEDRPKSEDRKVEKKKTSKKSDDKADKKKIKKEETNKKD